MNGDYGTNRPIVCGATKQVAFTTSSDHGHETTEREAFNASHGNATYSDIRSFYVDASMRSFELEQWFFAGCDGSSKFGTNGAFGWAIRTPDGEQAAVGMRPSREISMDSYRANCSGCLSILRFLIRLAEYTGRYEPWRGSIGTDSQSMMLDTVALRPSKGLDHIQHSFLKPLDINVPEWDLLNEIRERVLAAAFRHIADLCTSPPGS
jgi:hypothetical protein